MTSLRMLNAPRLILAGPTWIAPLGRRRDLAGQTSPRLLLFSPKAENRSQDGDAGESWLKTERKGEKIFIPFSAGAQ